jgi:predicted DNA-binding transcriptional regulator AlpA
MSVPNAFKPLTKNDLADVLGVSTRTIENWVNDGTLPGPSKLGNRVYWHPNTFYAWLDLRLSADAATADALQDATAAPQPRPEKSKARSQPSTAKNELAKVRNRAQAQLNALMA